MYQTSCGNRLLALCVCALLCSSLALDEQGWRKYDTAGAREELRMKIDQAAAQRGFLNQPGRNPLERWASRDKSMSPGRMKELMAAKDALPGESSSSSDSMFFPVLIIFVVGSLIIFLVVKGKLHELLGGRASYSYMYDVMPGQKASPAPSLKKNITSIQLETLQEAFVVLRHCSTRRMDRAMDWLAHACETVANSITKFTSKVRSRQRKKGDDDDNDVDLLHLKHQEYQHKVSQETYYGNSLNDIGKGEQKKTSLGEIDPILKDDELARFVDEVAGEGTADALKAQKRPSGDGSIPKIL